MPPLIPGPTSSWSCPSQTEHHLSIFSELTSQCLGTAWIWGTGSANKNRDSWSPEAWRSCVPEQLSMRSFLTLAKRCDHPPPLYFYRYIIEESLGLAEKCPSAKGNPPLRFFSQMLTVREAERCLSLSQHWWAGNEIRKRTGGAWRLKTDVSKGNWDFFISLYTYNWTWKSVKIKIKKTSHCVFKY